MTFLIPESKITVQKDEKSYLYLPLWNFSGFDGFNRMGGFDRYLSEMVWDAYLA